MRLKKYKYLFLIIMIIISGCDSDYLENVSSQSYSSETIMGNTENIGFAVNGLARLMVTSYLGSYSGEATVKIYDANAPGNHMAFDNSALSNLINGNMHDNSESKADRFKWQYYYKLIANANNIISSVDEAEGSESDKAYLKAQALGYRAYSYFMLTQFYGDRWVDSNGGETDAVVIRTSPDKTELPLSSLKDAYSLIYDDLDQAISLFESSDYSRNSKDHIYEINEDVVKAIYARAALTRQDYEKAAKYAKEARANYPLMSTEDYLSGFANPTSEWIWGSFDSEEESIGSNSFFGHMGYNSSTHTSDTKKISAELFEQIPQSDIRKDLFLNPEGFEYNRNTLLAGKDMEEFVKNKFPDIDDKRRILAYMQFKFKANTPSGVGSMVYFRSSEMILIEAEAQHFLGNDDQAQDLLEELNVASGRDPQYTCDLVGDQMFDEIEKYRAIELWGEGFDWLDYKRWKLPIDRKSINEGGSFIANYAIRVEPEEKNNWKWVPPIEETDHNNEIN